MQSIMKMFQSRSQYIGMQEESNFASIKIQCIVRRYLAKLELHRRKLFRLERRWVKVQALWRGGVGRVAAAKWIAFVKNRAASKIQAGFRGKKGRNRFNQIFKKFYAYTESALIIQKVFRGYLYGRLVSRRIKTLAAVNIQRVVRGMIGRWRALNWLSIQASTEIQKIVRSHLGRLYATRLYRKRVDDEQKRLERENKVVDAEQQKEQAKLLAFFNIPGGKREIRKEVRAIKRERRKAAAEYALLSPFMKKRADVEKIFKRFDADHSGSIDAAEFRAMIKDLCIPLGENELMRTMKIVDTDRNGTIEFEEFFAWYTADPSNSKASMTSDGSISEGTLARIKFQLKARKLWRDVTGASIYMEAKNRLLARKSKEVQRKVRSQFRKSNPCPFECKRCMAAFTFDYELTRHTEKVPDCDKRTVYHKLREDAMAREKEDQMNAHQQKVAMDFSRKIKAVEKQEKRRERRETRLLKEQAIRQRQLAEIEEN